MIATILPGSADFHAVGYNERKVSKGVATLIEMKNFGDLGQNNPPTTEELTEFLLDYSSSNQRIRKPQFHVAISCKGHELTEAELLDFAHRYLHEMGYDLPSQPLLVYAHHDTDNAHLHLITSRVAPDGRKIDHAHERRRSQQVIDRLLKMDRKALTEKAVSDAKGYASTTFAQFKAVMTSMGYETYKKDDRVFVKHGGSVQMELPLSDIEASFHTDHNKRTRGRQLRSILLKYRDVCSTKEELQAEMKKKFGVDIVFYGKKDTPYGYLLVDHNRKTVIHGAHVLAMDQLLDFATPEERLKRIEAYLDQLFTLNPKSTQAELHEKLRRYRAYIKKGVLYYKDEAHPLKPFMAEAIDRNNRIAHIERFTPRNGRERELLCQLYKVNRPDLVDIAENRNESGVAAHSKVKAIFEDNTATTSVRQRLFEAGYIIREATDVFAEDEPALYAVNFKNHTIVELNKEEFDLTRLQRPSKFDKTKRKMAKVTRKTVRKAAKLMGKVKRAIQPKDAGGGSTDSNREWEVGRKDGYGEVDNGQNMKR